MSHDMHPGDVMDILNQRIQRSRKENLIIIED